VVLFSQTRGARQKKKKEINVTYLTPRWKEQVPRKKKKNSIKTEKKKREAPFLDSGRLERQEKKKVELSQGKTGKTSVLHFYSPREKDSGKRGSSPVAPGQKGRKTALRQHRGKKKERGVRWSVVHMTPTTMPRITARGICENVY